MLRRAISVGLSLVVGLLLCVPPASAAEPIRCPPGSTPRPSTGECIIVATNPGGPSDGNPGGGGAGTGGGGGSTAPQVCTWGGNEIECEGEYGYWSDSRNCYVSPSAITYPPDSPMWAGHHPEGAIYTCYNMFLVGTRAYDFWAAAPPSGPAAPPDPRVLAQQAVAAMQLRAIDVGIVPEARPGSVGLVGMPNWMWVENPAQNTWGPITRTASAAGYTVTATARVAQVVWDMGDGQVVACGEGTPYEDSFGKKSSPTCGHTYIRQGEYTVTATSQWVITWSGIGQTGTITMDLTRSADLTIGEAQVLRQ